MSKKDILDFKVIILGMSEVGKTCLLINYFDKKFKENNISTTVFTYSNPYNKFDSNINKDEIFYFSLEFLNKAEDYNIYIDIKYMSNEGIVIKTDDASMVKEGEAYRLVPQMTIPFVNKIVYNINSCTDSIKECL